MKAYRRYILVSQWSCCIEVIIYVHRYLSSSMISKGIKLLQLIQEVYKINSLSKMKNQYLKKFQTSSQTYEKLNYIQTKSNERSDYNSLNKYNRSPYLQKVANQLTSKKKHHYPQGEDKTIDQTQMTGFRKKSSNPANGLQLRSFSNNSNYQLPKVNNTLSPQKKPTMFKLPKIDHDDSYGLQKQTAQSATLEFSSTKKKRLEPLRHQTFKCVMKTKAGTNGKQVKINQDCGFIDQRLPFGLKCYCVCDGHGLNGHIVSSYIKTHMIKNLTSVLKKQISQPDFDKMQQLIYNVFSKTNQSLLQSEINTQLSGSTVVAVFEYKNRLFCFNVGDSRAILCQQIESGVSQFKEGQSHEENQPNVELNSKEKFNSHSKISRDGNMNSPLMKMHLSKTQKMDKYLWKVFPLSNDQKPERQDEKERVIKNGGRIQCNRTERGEEIGPLRVWMKDIQMPGLAMTRSFGDKAGLRAGTSGQPEVTEHEVTEADKFIVLASDGVWQYLENQEVMNVIVPFYLRNDIDMAAQKVVKLATDIWARISLSRDDITLIIVSLNMPMM